MLEKTICNCVQVVLNALKQVNWWSLFEGLTTGALVPFLIMIFTLRFEKKCHKEDMKEQKENTRLGVLPIFNVVKMTGKVKEPISLSDTQNGNKRIILKISVENVGSGIAMSPTLKIDSCVSRIRINSMYESKIAYYDVYKDFIYNNAIIHPERTVEIQIAREEREKSEPEDTFIVPILFSDVLGNKYEQRIAITFLTKIEEDNDVEIVNVISGTPVLLPKDIHTPKKEDKNVNPNLHHLHQLEK